jgi:hypothetical protein
VALWFDADGILTSDVGVAESTVIVARCDRHCDRRPTCRTILRPPGRRVLVTRELLSTLVDDWTAAPEEPLGGTVVRIAVDHVAGRGGGQWVYRLHTVRWRDTDPPGYADPDLALGVWPD